MAHCHRNDCKLRRYGDDSEVLFCEKCGKHFRGHIHQTSEFEFNPMALFISITITILIVINLHHWDNTQMQNNPNVTNNNNHN